MQQLKENILKYLNLTSNRTTKLSLFEVVNKYSLFDINKKLLDDVTRIQFENTTNSIAKEEIKRNKTRIEHHYKINDFVYKKTSAPTNWTISGKAHLK
jgi:hypothetical protein